MAHISGMVDVSDDSPSLHVTDTGAVLISAASDFGLRFRTISALAAWLADVDEAILAIGQQQTLDTAEYHRKVQTLRAERDRL